MQTNTRPINPPIPAKVYKGDKLKAATINALREAIGSRIIKEKTIPFKGGVGGGEAESLWQFGMDYTSTTCTVYDGSIQIKGVWYYVDGDALALSGTPVFVYVNFNRVSLAGSIQQANSIPTNTATELNWMLASFTGNDGAYTLTKRYHKGAIQVDLPI